MSKPHILVIDDEPKIASLVRDYLLQEKFDVTLAADGKHIADTIEELSPALIVLDWMLPGEDGITICRSVRQHSSVPIIMLTARVNEADRLKGFEAGADDYVCKPFSPPELVARIRSVLRRALGEPASPSPVNIENNHVLSYREIRLDMEQYSCFVDCEAITLTPVEFRMLTELILHPGKVYSRYQLMRVIYQDHRVVCDRTIDSHVSNLRRKLALPLNGEPRIHSSYSVGYRLE